MQNSHVTMVVKNFFITFIQSICFSSSSFIFQTQKPNLMNIVERVKSILIDPKKEWEVIDRETTEIPQLITGYLLILALIPALASLIGYWLVGAWTFSWGVRYAVIAFISPVISVFIAAFVINALADSFGSQKDMRRAMQLVVYSYTAVLVAGIFYIIPALSVLAFIAGLYSLYLLYIGLQPMMKTPQEKVTTYFVVSLLVMIAVSIVVGVLLTSIIIGRGMTGMAF